MRWLLATFVMVVSLGPASAQNKFNTPIAGQDTILTVSGCLNLAGKGVPLGPACAGALPVGPSTGTGAYNPATIGASSGQVLAAGVAKVFLDLVNPSTTATIACAFGIPAVINGAGSITLSPLWHRSWPDGAGYVPGDVVNCIASAGSTPMTVGAK